jgi:hypothetical protein
VDPLSLGRLIFDRVFALGCVFHLNARSWEIDRNELWRDLQAMLHHIAKNPGISHLTNSEVLPPRH